MKLRTKVIVIPTILSSIVLITLFVFKANITTNITNLIDKNTPKLISIFNIEIHLDGMQISLLNILNSYDKDSTAYYLKRYNNAISDQQIYLEQLKKLSEGEDEQKNYHQLHTLRKEYLNLGNKILKIDIELKQLIQERRDILNNNIEFFLDSELQNKLNKNDKQYIEKQESLLEIEINIHELISAVRGYMIKNDSFLLDRVKDSEDDILFWSNKLNNLTWDEKEITIIKTLNDELNKANKLSDQIINLKIKEDKFLTLFRNLNIKLDNLIENVISKDVVKRQDRLSEQLVNRFNISVILLILFIALSLLSMYKVAKTFLNNIFKIINQIKDYSIEKKPTHINIDLNDEMGLLGHTINNMSSSIYKSTLERNHFINELNTLNKTLEDKILELNQKEDLLSQYILFSRTDPKGIITDVSQFFCNLSGYTKEELIGRSHNIVKHSDMPKSLYKDIWDTIKSGKEWKGEIKNRAKEGHHYWVDSRIYSEYDENGNIKGYISIREDITAKKDVEKQQLLLIEQAKMAAMGEMIGNIAHQWRQPLSVISTGVTGMQLQKEYGLLPDEEFNQICNDINKNAQYLSKTIDDFKNFIKGDRTLVNFALNETIHSFLNLVEGDIKKENINVVLDMQDDININGYPNELIQCLINIFNNAKDALKEQDIENKLIFITTTTTKTDAIIKIKDNAKGIKKELIKKIFEPYFTTKHKSQGTGLGLHMTYNLIVDGMKGSIEVNNVSYKHNNIEYFGAEFTISIPIELNS